MAKGKKTDNTRTETENAFSQSRSRLVMPEVGHTITVTLPGEIMRAVVVSIKDNDHIVCRLGQPMAKSHHFRKDQEVVFHRAQGMTREFWEAD
jgi:hypothetical protein